MSAALLPAGTEVGREITISRREESFMRAEGDYNLCGRVGVRGWTGLAACALLRESDEPESRPGECTRSEQCTSRHPPAGTPHGVGPHPSTSCAYPTTVGASHWTFSLPELSSATAQQAERPSDLLCAATCAYLRMYNLPLCPKKPPGTGPRGGDQGPAQTGPSSSRPYRSSVGLHSKRGARPKMVRGGLESLWKVYSRRL